MTSSSESHADISVESVLRIRPFSKREQEDVVVLEEVHSAVLNAPPTVVLRQHKGLSLTSPVASSSARWNRLESDSNEMASEYHFNHIFSDTASQDKIYYSIGLPIAMDAMNTLKEALGSHSRRPRSTKSHLIVSMGVAGSGKTYTCLGSSTIPKRRTSQDGLIPRLVDSLFSQSKHHTGAGNSSKSFSVDISMVQVLHSKGSDPFECTLQDLLGQQQKTKEKAKFSPKKNLNVRNMAAQFEKALSNPILSPLKGRGNGSCTEIDSDNIQPTIESCADVTQAREVLQRGLAHGSKSAKGQNHHFLISIQPVCNGNVAGDKIVVLDMAGLECGKKSNTRGKDSVANKNQAASAAVLHCLRTMIHNTNVRYGKEDPVDVADDAMSEISAVSSQKGPLEPQMKAVPFRQHKVSMLLQPFFTSCDSAKVTIMLAAYPGHTDYHQKRLLLQDTELLCGAALVSTQDDTTLHLPSAKSFDSRVSDEDTDVGDYDFYSVAEEVPKASVQGRLSHANVLRRSSGVKKDTYLPKPLVASASFTKVKAVSVQAVPSAPVLDTPSVMPPPRASHFPVQPPQNPDYVSDFPGVNIPPRKLSVDPVKQRKLATEQVDAGIVGGPAAWVPGEDRVKRLPERAIDKSTFREQNTTHSKSNFGAKEETRRPLARSHVENEMDRPNKKLAVRQKLRNLENQYGSPKSLSDESPETSNENKQFSFAGSAPTAVGNDSPAVRLSRNAQTNELKKESTVPIASGQKSQHTMDKLSQKLRSLQTENQALQNRCRQLEKENRDLIEAAKKAKMHQKSARYQHDEQGYKEVREARLLQQSLIPQSLRNHLDNVISTYELKNQWCKSTKEPFNLAIPGSFQRAATLDHRDRNEGDYVESHKSQSFQNLQPVHVQHERALPTFSPLKKLKRLMVKAS
eukprot:Nitzschia sp. Nitz4//scaffold40_size135432//20160//22895//NITZ4_003230-RA/size135432-processed-gene-0.57-mRNA-1//-1//CDS//3329551177//2312//frame0